MVATQLIGLFWRPYISCRVFIGCWHFWNPEPRWIREESSLFYLLPSGPSNMCFEVLPIDPSNILTKTSFDGSWNILKPKNETAGSHPETSFRSSVIIRFEVHRRPWKTTVASWRSWKKGSGLPAYRCVPSGKLGKSGFQRQERSRRLKW